MPGADRWIPITHEGRPAGYVVIDDDERPRCGRYVAHALPAVVSRETSHEPVKVRIRRRKTGGLTAHCTALYNSVAGSPLGVAAGRLPGS